MHAGNFSTIDQGTLEFLSKTFNCLPVVLVPGAPAPDALNRLLTLCTQLCSPPHQRRSLPSALPCSRLQRAFSHRQGSGPAGASAAAARGACAPGAWPGRAGGGPAGAGGRAERQGRQPGGGAVRAVPVVQQPVFQRQAGGAGQRGQDPLLPHRPVPAPASAHSGTAARRGGPSSLPGTPSPHGAHRLCRRWPAGARRCAGGSTHQRRGCTPCTAGRPHQPAGRQQGRPPQGALLQAARGAQPEGGGGEWEGTFGREAAL